MKTLKECVAEHFAVNSDWCMGSCNTLNDLSSRICIPHETEDLKVFLIW